MSKQIITVKTWAAVQLPENRRQCFTCTLPNIYGANTAANKPWQLQRQLDHMTPFHTEDAPLTSADIEKLLDRDFMDDPDYSNHYYKVVTVNVWAEIDGVLESN